MNALVVGACGQIGSELVPVLEKQYGASKVWAADIRPPGKSTQFERFEKLDVLDKQRLKTFVEDQGIEELYLMAALLSATAEKKPSVAWNLNMDGLLNVLELAKEGYLKKVFWPSSIAVFGPSTPKNNTPQHTIMDPDTVYGICKLAGENWCAYYHKKFGVDVRSIRYPGLISYRTPPGGGTTDYAVEIFYAARKGIPYTCFLEKDTALPMMYMPDAVRATIELMQAPSEQIRIRSSYNIEGLSFTPFELFKVIKSRLPDLEINFKPDFRQSIAEGWPAAIDGESARNDWHWKPDYSIKNMVDNMLKNINTRG